MSQLAKYTSNVLAGMAKVFVNAASPFTHRPQVPQELLKK